MYNPDKQVSEILSAPKYLLDTSTIKEAILFLQEHKIGSVLVVNEYVELVGIFTERDVLMKVAAKGDQILSESITKFMTADPISLKEEDTVATIAKAMKKGNFRHVPIINELNKPVGIVSIKDLFML